MSFFAIAAPISLDAALRLERASWPVVWAVRSSRSSRRMSATSPSASATPRDSQPAT